MPISIQNDNLTLAVKKVIKGETEKEQSGREQAKIARNLRQARFIYTKN